MSVKQAGTIVSGHRVVKTYSTAGTYTFTPPAGTSASNPLICDVTIQGAGGGGAGFLTNSTASDYAAGGGGSAGQLVQLTGVPVTAATTVVTGAAGSAGSAGSPGGAGGSSSFGTVVAAGGAAGVTGAQTPTATSLMPASATGAQGSANPLFVAMPNSLSNVSNQASSIGNSMFSITLPATFTWVGLVYGNGIFVAVGTSASNAIYWSRDGLTWTSQALNTTFSRAGAFILNNTFFITCISGSAYYTSTDAVTWTTRNFGTTGNSNVKAMAYGGGTYVALPSATAQALASTDGISWTSRPTGITGSWTQMVYGGGRFVACQGSTAGMYSTDAYTWTSTTLPSTNDTIAFGFSVFAMIQSGSANVYTSSDAVTWTTRTPGITTSAWTSITFVVDRWVICASQVSPTGITAQSADFLTNLGSWVPTTNVAWKFCAGRATTAAVNVSAVTRIAEAVPTGGGAGRDAASGSGGTGGSFAAPGTAGTASAAASAGQVPGAGGGGGGRASTAGAAGGVGLVTVSYWR